MVQPIDILVIDDEEQLCQVLKVILTKAGYHVETFQNGLLALDILQKKQIPLILCDITMPDIDGLQLIIEMKKKDITSSIVMLTAHQDQGRIITALQLGALDYVVKPFDCDSLISKVHGWVEVGRLTLEQRAMAEKDSRKPYIASRYKDLLRLKNCDLVRSNALPKTS